MKAFSAIIVLLLYMPAAAVSAQQHASPYAHTGSDVVKTLTQDEVEGLLAGDGMGLARPAEMNGLPGPKHVLELADSLSLTPEQTRAVEDVLEAMDTQARALGRRVIDAERGLDELFSGEPPDVETVREALDSAARLTAELRFVHIAAHLRVADLLSAHQIHEYARLRGYGAHEHGGA